VEFQLQPLSSARCIMCRPLSPRIRARTNARANLVRSLDSNSGLAQAFAIAEGQRGDWRKVFTDLGDLNNVTLEDLQRVANTYFTKDNLTVGSIVNEETGEVVDANQ